MRNNKFVIIHTIRLLNTNQHAYLKYKAKEIGTYNWKKYKNAMLDDYIKKSANKPKNYKSKCTNRENKATKKKQRNTNIQNTNFTNKPKHKNDFFTHKTQFYGSIGRSQDNYKYHKISLEP